MSMLIRRWSRRYHRHALLVWAAMAYLLCLAAVAYSAERSPTRLGTLTDVYDLDSTSYIYCVTGANYAASATSVSTLVTTGGGASTTIDAVRAASAPFAAVAVGDVFLLPSGEAGEDSQRAVMTKPSNDQITVNANITTPAAGSAFAYRTLTCGTGAENGWITTRGAQEVNFGFTIAQLNTTSGIDFRVEGRNLAGSTTAAVLLGPVTFTAVGGGGLSIQAPWDQMRLGLKMNTTDDGGDTGANAEQVTATFRLVGVRP